MKNYNVKALSQIQPKTIHTGRRLFATNLYLEKFSPIGIMKINGYKTESSFMKYIKTVDDSNAVALPEHWKKVI